MSFTTPITLSGPPRQPRQMLGDQTYDGHASVHDGDTADDLGLAGAPIEGPTHFAQFDPLCCALWGQAWFETGCISAHFKNMVVDGEEVVATATTEGGPSARIDAAKLDGTPVLTGTASIDRDTETELDSRLARVDADPGDLFIVDQLTVGLTSQESVRARVDRDTANGDLYPFSLAQKLDGITEPNDWYDSSENPWGRPVLPLEMISVLSQKSGTDFPVRGPAVGLFLDLEIRLLGEPVFVGQEYLLDREIVGVGQSRRTESYWVRTTVRHAGTGDPAVTILLHSGVFKESYADYPPDRL